MKHIGAAALFVVDILITPVVGVLFGLTFIAVQIGSWTGSKS